MEETEAWLFLKEMMHFETSFFNDFFKRFLL